MNDALAELIRRHEGRRTIAYQDSLGVWTVGVGHNLSKPISARAISQIFEDDLNEAINECLHAFPWFLELTMPRQHVIVDMCFNLGLTRLLTFKQFLAAVAQGNYDTAADEMLDSEWARQVKGRAMELAAMMRGSVET